MPTSPQATVTIVTLSPPPKCSPHLTTSHCPHPHLLYPTGVAASLWGRKLHLIPCAMSTQRNPSSGSGAWGGQPAAFHFPSSKASWRACWLCTWTCRCAGVSHPPCFATAGAARGAHTPAGILLLGAMGVHEVGPCSWHCCSESICLQLEWFSHGIASWWHWGKRCCAHHLQLAAIEVRKSASCSQARKVGLLKCSLNPSQYSPILTLGLVCLQKETKMRHLFHITAP